MFAKLHQSDTTAFTTPNESCSVDIALDGLLMDKSSMLSSSSGPSSSSTALIEDDASSQTTHSGSEESSSQESSGKGKSIAHEHLVPSRLASSGAPPMRMHTANSESGEDEDDDENGTEVEELLDQAPQHSPRPDCLAARGRSGSIASSVFPIGSRDFETSNVFRTDASTSNAVTQRPPSPVTSLFESTRHRHPADDGVDRAATPLPEPVQVTVADSELGPSLPPSFDDSQLAYNRAAGIASRSGDRVVSAPTANACLAIPSEDNADLRRTNSSRSALHQPREQGTFISVANSHLARLSADAQPSSSNPNRRSFFSNFFSPSLRNAASPLQNNQHSPNRNSTPVGTAFSNTRSHHSRTQSSPLPSPANGAFADVPGNVHRSGTLNVPSSRSGSPQLAPLSGHSNPVGLGFVEGSLQPPKSSVIKQSPSFFGLSQAFQPEAKNLPKIEQIGIRQDTLTTSISLSRNGQPTCGTILDEKYLLIGTTSGLDFLPLNHPEYKKPIPLIKRTRFKQLAILKDRSNVLLAVAGRNDHVRVYALDGIRAIIERKMKEVLTPSLVRVLANVAQGNSPLMVQGLPQPQTVPRAEAMKKPDPAIRRNGSSRAAPPAPLTLAPPGRNELTVSRTPNEPISPPPPYPPLSPARSRRTAGSRSSSSTTLNLASRSRNASVVAAISTNVQASTLRKHRSRETVGFSRRGSAATITAANTHGHPSQPPVPALPASTTSIALDEEGSAETDAEDAEWDRIERSDIFVGSESLDDQPCKTPCSFRTARTSETAIDDEPQMPRPTTSFSLRTTDAGEDVLPPLPPSNAGSPWTTRLMARSGSRENDRAFTQDLAAFFRGDNQASPERAPPLKRSHSSKARLMARSASTEGSSAGMHDLADFLRSGPPSDNAATLTASDTSGSLSSILSQGSTASAASAASVTTISGNEPVLHNSTSSPSLRLTPRAASVATMGSTQALADFLRNEPPANPTIPEVTQNQPMNRSASINSWTTVTNSPSENRNSPEVTSRQRKRWSMFDGRLGLSPTSPLVQQNAPESPAASAEASSSAREDGDEADAGPTASTSAAVSNPPQNEKRPRSSEMEVMEPNVDTSVDAQTGAASAILAEKHPASANAPLEFVKLARTKRTRLIRAVETSHRTFLAVLCGDAGERIELFTGARNVSLSLNRTFVLPESPRTIEFQLQGDELVDIYLMYDESIFALEPSTVRVREVGVLRNERRALRRERERERQNSGNATAPADTSGHPSSPDRTIVSTVTAPRPSSESAHGAIITANANPAPLDDAREPITLSAKTLPPFTTFQQLPFIPPVPASILAPAYVIPPTYSDVVEASPMPDRASNCAFDSRARLPVPSPSGQTPLLSPISLLANHPARNSGPPGLFFVTRGRTSTGIVDGDGRSVIKQAIHWLDADDDPLLLTVPESLRSLKHVNRIEIMITQSGSKTVLVAISQTEITAISVGHTLRGLEVIPDSIAKKRKKGAAAWDSMRDVVFLGSSGSRLYWSERLGNHVQIHRLSGV